MGESPGIPYVLEIWPIGSRSPIHNHAAVYGVIKVFIIMAAKIRERKF